MKARKKRTTLTNRTIAYIAAALVHAAIIGALFYNFSSKSKPMDAHYAEKIDVVKAKTVDENDLQKQKDLIKNQDEDRKRKLEEEQKKLDDLEKKKEQEKQEIEELEKKKVEEKKKADQLEAERKKIALEKKKEQERLEEQKKERERQEKLAKEKAKKEKAERERKEREAEAKREAERQAALAAQIEAEEAAQRATTLLAKYTALITDQVNRYRTIAPDFERWLTAKVNVKLSPNGDVQSVRIVQSSGNPRYDRSVETAIRQASPLPIPSVAEDAAVNKIFRDLNLIFDMTGV